jgi:hypothetical protein
MDVFEIPQFCKIPQTDRRAAWVGRKLTKVRFADIKTTRNEDASTKAFRRQVEREAKAKQVARFKMLRERAKAGR